MTRSISFLFLFAALISPTVHAGTPSTAPRSALRSEHRVRITPTRLGPGESAIEIGSNGWVLQGYNLRDLLARVFDIDPARVELERLQLADEKQLSDAGPRYDVSVDLTGDESDAAVQTMLRRALEDHFHLTIAAETRAMDVYVLTAPAGPGQGLRSAANLRVSRLQGKSADGSSDVPSTITIAGRVCPGISSAGITAQYATVERLAAALEDNLDGIVVDETHLTPAFDFQIPEYRSRDELFSLLHDALGLTIRKERREVKVLTAHAPVQSSPVLVTGI